MSIDFWRIRSMKNYYEDITDIIRKNDLTGIDKRLLFVTVKGLEFDDYGVPLDSPESLPIAFKSVENCARYFQIIRDEAKFDLTIRQIKQHPALQVGKRIYIADHYKPLTPSKALVVKHEKDEITIMDSSCRCSTLYKDNVSRYVIYDENRELIYFAQLDVFKLLGEE